MFDSPRGPGVLPAAAPVVRLLSRRRPASIALARPQLAVLEPVPADGHVAPVALPVLGAVVEGPAALVVGADPQA